VLTIFALLVAAAPGIADGDLSNLSVKELKTLERRAVVLHLASGRDLEGTVVRVTDRAITIERSKIPTYVDLGRIEAITVSPLTPPSRAELDTLAKTLAPPVAIEIDWKSIPDDGAARVTLSRAIEDLASALRKIASDADGKAALKKVNRVSFAFASGSSAALERSTLIVRWDPKNAADEDALQSMIENKL
jgi:hypothetical protein